MKWKLFTHTATCTVCGKHNTERFHSPGLFIVPGFFRIIYRRYAMHISRRRFLSALAGTSAVAAAAAMTGCRPVSDPSGQGWLPNQYRDQT
ncbi:MAG: twin-arginine translocation signal domain-containing protein, partial [Peptococcaceae bacterium]|nr:twin-arginine translocation signal domain-containing protein [Peptococcaceae bacterium]